jgi:Ribonuclease G/E
MMLVEKNRVREHAAKTLAEWPAAAGCNDPVIFAVPMTRPRISNPLTQSTYSERPRWLGIEHKISGQRELVQ